jgi:hypothetical protein
MDWLVSVFLVWCACSICLMYSRPALSPINYGTSGRAVQPTMGAPEHRDCYDVMLDCLLKNQTIILIRCIGPSVRATLKIWLPIKHRKRAQLPHPKYRAAFPGPYRYLYCLRSPV